jgi:flagellar biosynthetic protein FlhB
MAEKTEAPTYRRLSEARKKGQIVRSVELNSAAILLISMVVLKSSGKQLVEAVKTLMIATISALPQAEISIAYLRRTIYTDLMAIIPPVATIMLILLVTGVAITEAQTRFLWASDSLKPDFGRLNPINGLKRMFSARGLFELGKALLKLCLIGWVAYSYIRGKIPMLLMLSQNTLASGLNYFISIAFDLGIRIGAAYLVLAAGDYIYQRYTFMKNMRMTKEEVKEEMKQMEGDPFIKGRIRGQMRRNARRRMMANVPKASVVITNPTHLAIALEYDSKKMKAPKIVAKGAHRVAFKIVEIAKANNVPVVQNIPLARGLYKAVDLDQEIPPEFYKVIAELLAYVYRLHAPARRPAMI